MKTRSRGQYDCSVVCISGYANTENVHGTSPPRQILKFQIILKFRGFIFLPAWQARKGEVEGEEEKRDPSRFFLSSLSPTPFPF